MNTKSNKTSKGKSFTKPSLEKKAFCFFLGKASFSENYVRDGAPPGDKTRETGLGRKSGAGVP